MEVMDVTESGFMWGVLQYYGVQTTLAYHVTYDVIFQWCVIYMSYV